MKGNRQKLTTIDWQELHDAIKVQLEVIKAEEEKKAKKDRLEKMIFITPDWFYRWVSEVVKCDEDIFYSKKRFNNTIEKALQEAKEELKATYMYYLIRSIISSLWLWATAMFLILNT